MGIAIIFVGTATPICSMLQAVGRVDLPVKLMAIGVAVKIITNYVLVGIPEINIQEHLLEHLYAICLYLLLEYFSFVGIPKSFRTLCRYS